MDVSLPDIIGEYVDTPERFETGGVQYAGYFEPSPVAPGQTTSLYLFLQSMLDGPLTVNIKISTTTGRLFGGGQTIFKVD